MKHWLLAVALICFGSKSLFGYGGDVVGTSDQSIKKFSINAIPKATGTGTLAASSVLDNGTGVSTTETVSVGVAVGQTGTLVVKSTTTVTTTPIVNIQDSTGASAFQVLQSSATVFGGAARLNSRTLAYLVAYTPIAVGEAYYCNNCSPAKIVVSTGTSASNFADAVGGTFK